jgi:hypothetical protein
MTTTTAIRFLSVDRPELVLDEDDVFLCPDCEAEGSAEYARVSATWGECSTCQGWRIIHGLTSGGRGLPVTIRELHERGVDLHALYRAQWRVS